MAKEDYGLFFKFIQRVARLILPRYRFERPPDLEGPAVFVAHHQNMVGPVSILAWLKYYIRTWVLGEFYDQEAAYDHYVNYTFTKRYGWPKFIAKMIAWPVSHIVSWITKSGNMIPVYRKSRKIVKTMRISHEALISGQDIIIFPDVDYSSDSKETSDIYEGFLHLEKRYYKETNKHLTFIPVLSDKSENIVRVGKEIRFTGKDIFIKERKEIAEKIRKELNRLAQI